LQEVRKEDLKEFTNLKALFLPSNDLKVLEADLFVHNPNLKAIYLHNNKIVHINEGVFDNFIGELRRLYLSGNPCTFGDAVDIRKADDIIVRIQRGSCEDEAELLEFLAQAPITTSSTITEELIASVESVGPSRNMKLVKAEEPITEELIKFEKSTSNEELDSAEESITTVEFETNDEPTITSTLKNGTIKVASAIQAVNDQTDEKLSENVVHELMSKIEHQSMELVEVKEELKDVINQNKEFKAKMGAQEQELAEIKIQMTTLTKTILDMKKDFTNVSDKCLGRKLKYFADALGVQKDTQDFPNCS
jgi:hypothetical protein